MKKVLLLFIIVLLSLKTQKVTMRSIPE